MRIQASDSFRVLILVILSMLTLFIFLKSAYNIYKVNNREKLSSTVLSRLNIETGTSNLKNQISYVTNPKEEVVEKTYYFKVLLCVHKGQDESKIKYLLSNAVDVLKRLGVGIKLKIENIRFFSTKHCNCNAGKYDMVICYGPYDGSGYIGPPRYVLFVNSSSPINYATINSVANTILYYLGVEPLFCYHIGNKIFYHSRLKNNLQYTIYTKNPVLFKIQDYIATYNLFIARKYGKSMIYYPNQRLLGYTFIFKTNSKNVYCYIYKINCDMKKEVGIISENPIKEVANPNGVIKFEDVFGTPTGIKIFCQDGKTYWLFSLEMDKCFFYSKKKECVFDCRSSNICVFSILG